MKSYNLKYDCFKLWSCLPLVRVFVYNGFEYCVLFDRQSVIDLVAAFVSLYMWKPSNVFIIYLLSSFQLYQCDECNTERLFQSSCTLLIQSWLCSSWIPLSLFMVLGAWGCWGGGACSISLSLLCILLLVL